jgi:hypothetical protein
MSGTENAFHGQADRPARNLPTDLKRVHYWTMGAIFV